MENILFVIRGVSGSGKTTLAHSIADAVCSADDYFTDNEGNYNFDASKLKDAHEDCRTRVEQFMTLNESKIAVANTFTQKWEFTPYIKLAAQYGYRVHTIIVENRHGGENVHGVPDEVLTRMRNRFDIKL